MYICNLKVNNKLLFKLFFCLIFILALVFLFFAIYKIFNYKKVDDCIPQNDVIVIDSKNYTNILRTVHDDIESYIGKQISFSGYVYRVYDFTSSQFVLARDMLINKENETLVVGFLCESNEASKFSDNSWINITRYNKKRRLSW